MAYNNRAYAKLELQDYAGALEDANKVLLINPSNKSPYRHLGNAYRGLERYEDSLASFAQGVELLPEFAKMYRDRAKTYRAMAAREEYKDQVDELIEHALADEKKAEELS